MSTARTQARRCAVQALYQWQVAGQELCNIEKQFLEDPDYIIGQSSYFRELLYGVPKDLGRIDAALSQFVDRPIEKLDPVERAILRIGAYELLHRLDIPFKVVLNEGINLAKRFGATESHKYVNGVLHKVARKHRTVERQTYIEPASTG
ncbi:MAG: transcription antitermination factor NusB [Methylococcales bacterium]